MCEEEKNLNTKSRVPALLLVAAIAGCSSSPTATNGNKPIEQSYARFQTAAGNPDRTQQTNERSILSTSLYAPGVQVTTLAGNGTYSFADAHGTAAGFSYPTGLAMTSGGDLLIADTFNSRIRKLSPQGDVTTFAGTGEPGGLDGSLTSATFFSPYDLEVDTQGNVFVIESVYGRIRKITPDGNVSVYTSGITEDGYPLNFPFSLAAGPNGVLYISEGEGCVIHKVTPDGVIRRFAGDRTPGYRDGQGAEARFGRPAGIDVDASGNVYVADVFNHSIRKITPDGTVSTLAGTGERGFVDGPAATAKFGHPVALDVGKDGAVYVTEASNNSVRKLTPDGQVVTLAGNGTTGDVDGDGATARFSDPEGIYVDDSGVVYVSDSDNCRIKKLTVSSQLDLNLSEPSFSPNNDKVKDEIDLSVTATGKWTLEVVGHSGRLDGSPLELEGSKTFAWNGAINGIILPDGRYTLRLKAGAEEKTADVVIDKVAPTISSSKVPRIDERSENDKAVFAYTFDCKAEDGAQGSLVDPNSMRVTFQNATFTSPVATESTEADTYCVKADYLSAPRSSTTLKYAVVISDNAGNTSQPFNATFASTETEEFVMSGGSLSSTSSAYQVLAKSFPEKPLKNDFVFYVRSGLVGQAEYRFYCVDLSGNAISGKRDIFIVNTSTGKDYKKHEATYGPGFTRVNFDWNGQEYNLTEADGSPKVAPTGRYVISIYKGNEFKQSSDRLSDLLAPWNKGKIRMEIDRDSFKVSDKKVLKYDDWNGLSPATQTIGDALHTCIRHIVDNPAAGGALGPARFFGNYDGALGEYPSPIWPWPQTYTPQKYNEKREQNHNYAITRFLRTRPAYNSVLQIARGLWTKGKQEPGDDSNARFMPVVLPTNGDILWVRAILNGGSMTTVYPFVTDFTTPAGNTIVGQKTYETNIR